MRKMLFLVVFGTLLFWGSSACPGDSGESARSYEWPWRGSLQGVRVNLRDAPSAASKILGQFASEVHAGELVVIAESHEGDAYPWYRVVSAPFGEGWIYGKYVVLDESRSPVHRYAMKIREDYGISPALARERYGSPSAFREEERFIPDFNTHVAVEFLAFHGHQAVYWNGVLQSLTISGGFMGFGDIFLGMHPRDVVARLGEPWERDGELWRFADEGDSIEVEWEKGPRGEEDVIVKLTYRRAVYE